MADTTSMTPAEAASKVLCSAHGDFLREAIHTVLRDIMESEVTVVAEAYVNGVSTRKVERLVEQLGVESISRSTVSCLCPSP